MDTNFNATRDIKQMSLEATIMRADGTVEELGTVAFYSEDPEKMKEMLANGVGQIELTR